MAAPAPPGGPPNGPREDEDLAHRVADAVGDGLEKARDKLEELAGLSTDKQPRLEQLGMRVFAKRAARHGPGRVDSAAHILDAEERAEMRRVSRSTILRAAMIGALAGLGCGIAGWLTLTQLDATTTFWEDVRDFFIVNAAVIAVTAVEVYFLYRNSLTGVHRLAAAAGIRLVPDRGEDIDEERQAVAIAMIRAALELPNPPDNPFRIDPYREISRWRVVLATLVYKLKITLTNFILRLLLRRVAGRVAVHAWLPFVDVPVTAAWDAAVTWRVLREARIRGLGPSAAEAFAEALLADRGTTPEHAHALARAAAVGVVRSRDMHPNLGALLAALARRTGAPGVPDLGDAERFLTTLDGLDEDARTEVLCVLVVAAFIDGRLARAERRLYATAMERCGRAPDLAGLKDLRDAFSRGDELPMARIQAVAMGE